MINLVAEKLISRSSMLRCLIIRVSITLSKNTSREVVFGHVAHREGHMSVAEISHAVTDVLAGLRAGESLSETQLDLLLTPAEVEAVLSWKKGSLFSRRNISGLLRDGRLRPSYEGGGGAYRYRLRDVLAVQLRSSRGRPRKPSRFVDEQQG